MEWVARQGQKRRVRIGEDPDPGGLFHLARRAEEEIAGWLRIGGACDPSAEFRRTSSYSPSRFVQPSPVNL